MFAFFKNYVIALITFLLIDSIWLGLIAKNLYSSKIGHLMAGEINWIAAILFYLIYVAGIIYFAVLPALHTNSLISAILSGAFLGFLCYATYDLTNYATLEKWPLSIVLLDLIWGTFITSLTSLIVVFIGKRI